MTKQFETLEWCHDHGNHPAKHTSGQLGILVHDDWGLEDHITLEDRLSELRESLRVTKHTMISEVIAVPGNPLLGFLESVYDEIIARRPELQSIRCSSAMDLYHIVYGCISQFNIDDIKYFVEDKYARRIGWYTHEKEITALETRYGFRLYWAPSETTFVKIKEVLKNDFGFQ